MKISGSYTVPLPREKAYSALQDPAVLAKCMPGTDHLEKIGEDEYRMKMKMALAALSGAFDGKVAIKDKYPPESFRLDVQGTGKLGFMNGGGLLRLTAQGESSTEVAYDGDVNTGGAIAAVGQRLLDATARMMIKKFFESLAVEAGAGS